MMYYVQYTMGDDQWINDMKYASLDEALSFAVTEARTSIKLYHRVTTLKKNGKTKVLAKFKPMAGHQ
jgi:hypothetical protein